MELVVIQHDIAWEDKEKTLESIEQMLENEAIAPGSLLVFPEMFSTGFSMNVAQITEGTSRRSERFLAGLARRYRSLTLGGVVTASAEGRGRNEAVVFSADGEEIARFQKIHPFGYGGEARSFDAGGQIVLFDWNGFRVAPFICYDLRFPEIFRLAACRGAELFVVIANWPQARAPHWMPLLQARAIENQAYVVGVNRVGSDPAAAYAGGSLIIDPRGQILTAGDERPAILRAQPDRASLVAYRDSFPAVHDMRSDWWREL